MKFISLFAQAALCLSTVLTLQVAPEAGSFGLVLNSTSVNNVMKTVIPIAAYFGLNNKTFDINLVDSSSIFYKFILDKIHVVSASGFTTTIFEELPGTDQVHVKLGGIDVQMLINAELDALHSIPFKTSAVNATGLGIEFTLESTSADQVHWKLVDHATVTVGKVDIEMANSWLNWLVKESNSVINKIIQSQLGAIGKAIDSEVVKINDMVAHEGAYTFDVSVFGKNQPLNLTMTTAPMIKKDEHLIKLNFDGLFDKPQDSNSGYNFELEQHDYFPDIAYTHREQFWLHQNSINSLINVAGPSFFPYSLASADISAQLLQVFPEVAKHYGKNSNISLDLTLATNGKTAPVKMTTKDGIVLGNLEDSVTTLGLVVSNGTVVNETAVIFEMHMQSHINFTMQNTVFYPFVKRVAVTAANATHDKVGMYSHDYTTLFNSILQDFATSWNLKNKAGIPLAQLAPQAGMIGGLLQNTTISPYVADGWMYAGFSMFADNPIKEEAPVVHQLNFLQE